MVARTRTFETGIALSIWDGDEREFVLSISYEFTPEQRSTWDEPGHGAAAEITAVRLFRTKGTAELAVPAWLSDLIEADESLLMKLVSDAQESDASERADADERRADEARELRMMEAR